MSTRVKSGKRRAEPRQSAIATEKVSVQQRIEGFVLASPQKRNLAICLLLAVATLALYSPAIGHPFIFNYDDDVYVTNNAHVKAGLQWQTIRWALTSTEYSNWHPLTWLSHAMDCQLYGLNPSGHHLTNVLLHTLNVVLLFLLLAYATKQTGRSFLVAALFAIHPFNVESVAWIAERKNVLSTFFFLLTIGAYGWYGLKPNFKRYFAVAALFALALASKAMVVTLPCVLFLLDFWPLRRIQGLSTAENDLPVPQMSFWRLVLEKLPLLALSAATSAVTIFAQHSGGAMKLVLPLGVRLENATYAYAMYVWKAFWPAWLGLFYPHPGATLAVWRLALAALFLCAVSVLVWWQRTARPYLVTGWLWFLGTLVPVIGLVQVGEQAIADRYAYIPLIGIFVMMVWGAADLADKRQTSFRSRVKIAAAVIAIFAFFTIDQLRYWRSAVDIWAHTVEVTKDNYLAEQNLGAALLAADRYKEALPHFIKAAKLRPADPAAHLNLGGDLALSDHPREAIAQYEAAILLTSDPVMRIEAYEILGRLYSEIGQYTKARGSYEQALKIDPEQAKATRGLAKVELSDAIRQVAEGPSAERYFRLGQVFQQNGRTAEALAAYKQALKLNPKLGEAKQSLDALTQQNK
jgi:tetratricopeptide (TPR) repeat protein